MPYWDNDQAENMFMEVTKRNNIGDEILAPFATNGSSTASNLAQTMKEGDIVIHYNSVDRAIVRISRVSGNPRPTVFDWTSPNAGAKSGSNDGIGVPLCRAHVEVAPPITLDEIRRKQKSIFAIKRQLEKQFGEKHLYFPWIDYRVTLRTALPYLNKVPRAAVALFPNLQQAVESLP